MYSSKSGDTNFLLKVMQRWCERTYKGTHWRHSNTLGLRSSSWKEGTWARGLRPQSHPFHPPPSLRLVMQAASRDGSHCVCLPSIPATSDPQQLLWATSSDLGPCAEVSLGSGAMGRLGCPLLLWRWGIHHLRSLLDMQKETQSLPPGKTVPSGASFSLWFPGISD